MPKRATIALAGAGVGGALLILTWLLTFHVGFAERADQSIFRGFADLSQHPHVGSAASFIAQLCNPQTYVYLAVVPVLVALVRRRWTLAVAICVILVAANETTQLLKPLLAQPRAASLFAGVPQVDAASWPSGHATAAMVLALCLVLAVPARLRPLAAALGAGFAVAVSYSFLALQWHYPSDVLGGFLIATIWTLLGAAAVLYLNRRRVSHTIEPAASSWRELLAAPAAAVLLALTTVALVLLVRPHQVLAYVDLHHAWVLGAAGIAAAAITLASGVTVALRPDRRPAP